MGTLRTLLPPLALYVSALGALLFQLGEHPPYPYNWESYTAWNYWTFWELPGRAPAERWLVTDGLMTDSGRGPLLGPLIKLGVTQDGVGLAAMRWPLALVTAFAVPLTWEVGRRLMSRPAALMAALLLAVSPVFLLYGRTATLVGISLVPALLTVLALVGVFTTGERRRFAALLIGLQACLVLGAYAYAPVRLLWPLAVAALSGGALAYPARRHAFLRAAGVTMLALPIALLTIEWLTTSSWPPEAIPGYFQARGEQVFELGDNPERYLPYLREMPASADHPLALAWGLFRQNVLDMAALLIDWQTSPVVTDYWNPHGQLWPWLIAPFFCLGFLGLIVRSLRARSWRASLLLILLLGLTVPLLFTTRVHVGRLVPALPLLLLTAAHGWSLACAGVVQLACQLMPRTSDHVIRLATMASSGLVIIIASALLAIGDYRHLPADSQESRIAAFVADLKPDARERGGAALVAPADYGLEIEAVRAATLWLALNREYRVVDLTAPEFTPSPDDDRPPLYAVGVLPRLAGDDLPNACDNLYLVLPDAAAEFQEVAASRELRERCPAALGFEVLPE